MKTETGFSALATQFLDRWLQTSSDIPAKPSTIYHGLVGRLTMKMRLTVTHVEGDIHDHWCMEPIRHSSFFSRLIDLNSTFNHGRFADFADQDYLRTAVIPRYSEILDSQKPSIEVVKTQLLGLRVGYDRLLLPQKSKTRPGWILALSNGRFLTQAPPPGGALSLEDQLLLHLLSEGASAREAADMMEISPRTVEHRIERMKTRFGARNVVNLIVIALNAEMQGSGP